MRKRVRDDSQLAGEEGSRVCASSVKTELFVLSIPVPCFVFVCDHVIYCYRRDCRVFHVECHTLTHTDPHGGGGRGGRGAGSRRRGA